MFCVPELNAPVPEGLLVKELAAIVCTPPECVSVTVVGRVISYVYEPLPLTVKDAAVTVPVVAGKVTPLVLVRVPAGANTTVPPVAVCTAILPKLMSVFFEILIGVTTVAVAVAVAVACAFICEVKPARSKKVNKILFFIFIRFCLDFHINAVLKIKLYFL